MKLFRNNSLSLFPLYIFGMPVIFFLSLLGYAFEQDLSSLMIGFLVVYAITLAHSIIQNGFLTLYNIYLYTSLFFIYDCFVFSIFFDKNFLVQAFPRYTASEYTGFIFLCSCYLTIYVMHITYCLFSKRSINQSDVVGYNFVSLEKAGIALMLVFIFPVMYKIFLQFNYVRIHGYESLYMGGMETIKYPFWCSGSFIFFTTGYVLFFSSNPSKKKYIIFTMLFFIVYGFDSLKGQRGPIISLILISLFLFAKNYKVQIRLKHLVILLCGLIFLIVSINNLRSSYGNSNTSNKEIVNARFIREILYGQTTSRAVPLIIIDKKLDWHPYPFVFSPFLSQYYNYAYPSSGQDVTSAEHYNNISQVTMYNISKAIHLAGGGLGGAFLGEAYDCGGFIGVAFWSIFIALILVVYDFKFNSFSVKFRPILYLYLLQIPTMPRGRIFGIMMDFNKVIFVYLFFILFCFRKYIFRLKYEALK